MKNEFYFISCDGTSQIHVVEWLPQGEPKAILQMCHGMAEYIERYGDFAEYLASQGFYVVGHDHLGHGGSVKSTEQLGYFHDKKGNEYVVGDIHKLRVMTERRFPHVPYFIMGHSMGSFLVRQYLGLYGSGLAGAIVMGTGDQPNAILYAGRAICKAIALFRGDKYRSAFVDGMAAGGYDKHFKNDPESASWLSRNPENVRKYRNDLLCGYIFTVNAYYHMFTGMLRMNYQERAGKIPKRLPIFLVAGQEDPVGNFGKSVEKVYRRYRKSGLLDVNIKLYEKDRHEILNEVDNELVYKDILEWMEEKI